VKLISVVMLTLVAVGMWAVFLYYVSDAGGAALRVRERKEMFERAEQIPDLDTYDLYRLHLLAGHVELLYSMENHVDGMREAQDVMALVDAELGRRQNPVNRIRLLMEETEV